MASDFWTKNLAPVEITPGESGYFSMPGTSLDPHLFGNTMTLRPEIRTWILDTLYSYWDKKWNSPKLWSQVWLAGSGVSYQWSAARGNGDLDVLIGINFPEFFRHNPDYLGFGEVDVADFMNQDLHQNLWPTTATTNFNGQFYEVTYYVNPHSDDIRNINPYAAYSVTFNTWTVKPNPAPDHSFPSAYWKAAGDQENAIHDLVGKYNHYVSLSRSAANSAVQTNSQTALNLITSQAKTMFDDIHLGRRQAFGPGGSGYGDYYNFRWQYHKRAGTIQALDAIAHQRSALLETEDQQLYGRPIMSAQEAIRNAVWSQRR